MLNKLSLLLAATTVALSAGTAAAQDHYANDNQRQHGRGNALAIDIGAVAFGYNDGYWDTGHRWHAWRNRTDMTDYRTHGQNFHGWNHTRDSDKGWKSR